MPKAHRKDDKRICDALTIVQNQDSVFVNQKLWAIKGSLDTHGPGGPLHASPDESVTIHKIPVVVHRPEDADPDEDIENPQTAEGSDNVYAYGS